MPSLLRPHPCCVRGTYVYKPGGASISDPSHERPVLIDSSISFRSTPLNSNSANDTERTPLQMRRITFTMEVRSPPLERTRNLGRVEWIELCKLQINTITVEAVKTWAVPAAIALCNWKAWGCDPLNTTIVYVPRKRADSSFNDYSTRFGKATFLSAIKVSAGRKRLAINATVFTTGLGFFVSLKTTWATIVERVEARFRGLQEWNGSTNDERRK